MPSISSYGPVRGLRNVEGALFAVCGNSLIEVREGSPSLERGTIPGIGRVGMSHNQITGGSELVIVNGSSGYVWNTVTQTLTQITDEGFPGSVSTDYVDSYITHVEPFGRYWFHSDLADALSYNTLDRYEAEASPDRIVAAIVNFREVWVFSERTTEVFVNTGASEGTFERASGSVIEKGLASRWAVARMDSGLFWLGSDGVVYRANGYTPQRISTHPIESAIKEYDLSTAFSMVWEDEGHAVWYLSFPNGRTFGFDASTGLWHRRQSQGLNGWRVGHLARWNGRWVAGDIYSGGLYELDWDTYNEAGQPLVCERTTGTFFNAQRRVFYGELELVMDTGSANDHKVQLCYSDDFGRNYSTWKEQDLGGLGEYERRVHFRRMGSARNRIWRIRVSSEGKRDLIAATLTAETGEA